MSIRNSLIAAAKQLMDIAEEKTREVFEEAMNHGDVDDLADHLARFHSLSTAHSLLSSGLTDGLNMDMIQELADWALANNL